MAQRSFIGQSWRLEKGIVTINARFLMSGTTPVLQVWNPPAINSGTVGAYGTASTTAMPQGGMGTAGQGAAGVKSVTRTNTGLWTVQLQDNYNRLIGLSCYQSLAGGLSTIVVVGENTTISSMTAAGGSKIGVALMSSTATVADPGDGTSVTLTFVLQNSTAP